MPFDLSPNLCDLCLAPATSIVQDVIEEFGPLDSHRYFAPAGVFFYCPAHDRESRVIETRFRKDI